MVFILEWFIMIYVLVEWMYFLIVGHISKLASPSNAPGNVFGF